MSGTSGGLSAGNQGGTTFVGTEGWQTWDLYSDDGANPLGCSLKASFRKPFWGVLVESSVVWTLEGAGCQKPPLAGGPASFQDNYNVVLRLLDQNVSPPQGWSKVNLYYESSKNERAQGNSDIILTGEICVNSTANNVTWYELDPNDIQGQDLDTLQYQSYISAQNAALRANPGDQCFIKKPPEFSQICVGLVDNYTDGYTAVEYQYEAKALYSCGDAIEENGLVTFKSLMYNLYQ